MTQVLTYDEIASRHFPDELCGSRETGLYQGRGRITPSRPVAYLLSLSLIATATASGVAPSELAVDATSNGSNVIYRRSQDVPLSSERPAPKVSEQVESILQEFSLPVSKAARVLGVSRPTVYAWRRGEENLEPANRRRLVAIYELAEMWRRMGKGPLGERGFVPFLSDHKSVFDLLSQKGLEAGNWAEIRRRLELLSKESGKAELVGDRDRRWRREIGVTEPEWETQEINLDDAIRSFEDES